MGESGLHACGLFVLTVMMVVGVGAICGGAPGLLNSESTETTSWRNLLANGLACTPQMGYVFSLPSFSPLFFEHSGLKIHVSVDAGKFPEKQKKTNKIERKENSFSLVYRPMRRNF